jgi:cobyric acid synthase
MIHRISRDIHKLAQTLMLIKKKTRNLVEGTILNISMLLANCLRDYFKNTILLICYLFL